MFDQLLNMFGQSRQGQAAYQQLQSQGYTPQQSAGILTTAFPAAAQAMQNALQSGASGQGLGLLDITNSNYATNFLSAAVAGLVRGGGLKGAAIDGLQGVVGGHVAQVIASRCGLPERVAGVVGAIITPLMIDFLWEKYQQMQASGGGLAGLFGSGTQPQQPAAVPQGFGSNFTPFGR